jgi:serine phosphatase RsbU (regulator of sigma subunit)
MATLCLILLDPSTGQAWLANAGHLPPLLIADGQVSQIWQRAPLLGLDVARPASLEFTIAKGGTILLYTDGLVERRDIPIRDSVSSLSTLAARVDADLDAYCQRLLDQLTSPPNPDDVAVVALRRNG